MEPRSRAAIEKITGPWKNSTALAGGSIASVTKVDALRGAFVIKYQNEPPPGLFASEAECLAALAAAGVATPEVLLTGEDFLLMRFVEAGRPDPVAAGKAVATLHRVSQAACGFQRDTYLATFLQPNALNTSWADFYLQQRLAPMLKRLNLPETELQLWKDFGENVRAALEAVQLFSLLHGDLWPGNLMYGKFGPVLIDPACYYGDPLVDIAMSQLFGGLGDAFYKEYHSHLPLRENQQVLLQIYQIYPLLTHAVLFGSAYYAQAQWIRDNLR